MGDRWNVSEYLFLMSCGPLNMPSGANKTPSYVKSAAREAASPLLNASSYLQRQLNELFKCFGTPRRSRCWTACGSTASFCCGREPARQSQWPTLRGQLVSPFSSSVLRVEDGLSLTVGSQFYPFSVEISKIEPARMAEDAVFDSKSPDVYFVSAGGAGVMFQVCIRSFQVSFSRTLIADQ